jgi:hypothetical protein
VGGTNLAYSSPIDCGWVGERFFDFICPIFFDLGGFFLCVDKPGEGFDGEVV